MAKMSRYNMNRIGLAAAMRTEEAVLNKQFMDGNEQWAQEWFGCSYEEIRWKSPSDPDMQPIIDKWLESLKTAAPKLRTGCIEVLEVPA